MYTSRLSQFHLKCNINSITSKLTIDLTLNYVKIFEFQNGSPRKLTYNKVYRLFGLGSYSYHKVDLSMFVIKFNFEWITLAVKQISGITKKLIWVIKEQNMQTFILRPIFASIHVQKWTSVKHDLFHRLARDRKSPRQRRNRSLIFLGKSWFGEKSVRQTACLQRYFIRSQ